MVPRLITLPTRQVQTAESKAAIDAEWARKTALNPSLYDASKFRSAVSLKNQTRCPVCALGGPAFFFFVVTLKPIVE